MFNPPKMKKIFVAIFLLLSISVNAQKTRWPWQKKPKQTILAMDTTKKPVITPSAVKPYNQIITAKAITANGLFKVHKVDDKWYFEIPDSIMNRQMMAITRFVKTPAGGGIYGGEKANEQTVYFESGPDKKILLRVSAIVNVADSSQKIYKAVLNTSINPIAAVFEVKAYGKNQKSVVIDVTSFFKDDNQIVSISPAIKKNLGLASLAQDRSFIEKISSYPINTEVRTLKTFIANPPVARSPLGGGQQTANIPAAMLSGSVTLEMNTSFILLPNIPMRKRLYDMRVGYFYDQYSTFTDSAQKADDERFILRWRLEPKPGDIAKYKRGELVEPIKPIVYYIDPATPKKWRPYLIQGINDWQKAFEKVGFKNAIIGKEWPESDSTMSLEDARFSVVRYFASPISNAYGPNVHDPRSGEIIESHVGWYSNVTKLIHDWYMVQAGAIDPRAHFMNFDDELMGQLIRFVSSHEIGHTLGLRHNFGSSSLTPVENLRNKAWVETHGHTASIMDYARFNYVAQPQDHIGPAGIYPRIGAYDNWAIEWGYKPIFETKDEYEDAKILNKLTVDSLKSNKYLWFGSEDVSNDFRIQAEDLSDNSMKASEYGIENLKREVTQLPLWTYKEGNMYANLEDMYGQVVNQYARYLGHVTANIGSSYHNFKSVEQAGNVFEPMSRGRQKEAVAFLNRHLFHRPDWLINPPYIYKISPNPDYQFFRLVDAYFSQLTTSPLMTRIVEFSTRSKDSYTLDEYLTDLETCLFTEIRPGSITKISAYRQHLQKAYVKNLLDEVYLNFGGSPSINESIINTQIPSIVLSHFAQLSLKIKNAIPPEKDKLSKAHLSDLYDRVEHVIKIGKK